MQEMQETWVQSLGREDPLEEGIAAHSSIAAGNPMDRVGWRATDPGVTESRTQLNTHTERMHLLYHLTQHSTVFTLS